MPHRRAWVAAVAVAIAGALLLAPAALAGVVSPQSESGSPNAGDIKTLYQLILAIAVVVFLGVEGLLIYCIVKYKARKGLIAAQIHGNTRLEVGWTVGAAIILVFITTVTFIKLSDIVDPAPSLNDAAGNQVARSEGTYMLAATDQPEPPNPKTALHIRVDGQQYVWRYQYPGPKRVFAYETMVVPRGTTVTLDISADDVAHSFWIPALAGKADAIPGYINKMWFRASNEGTYTGQCAELCGRNHANMYARVEVVSPQEYQRWYADKAAQIQQSQTEVVKQRKALQAAETGAQAKQGGGGAGGASDDQ